MHLCFLFYDPFLAFLPSLSGCNLVRFDSSTKTLILTPIKTFGAKKRTYQILTLLLGLSIICDMSSGVLVFFLYINSRVLKNFLLQVRRSHRNVNGSSPARLSAKTAPSERIPNVIILRFSRDPMPDLCVSFHSSVSENSQSYRPLHEPVAQENPPSDHRPGIELDSSWPTVRLVILSR